MKKFVWLTAFLLLFYFLSFQAPAPALSAPAGLNVYFGDIHVHTNISQDANPDWAPQQAYEYAINQRALNFIAVTDHAYQHYQEDKFLDSSEWQYLKAVADSYYQPGEFATLYGYEWNNVDHSIGLPGHKNVYFKYWQDEIFYPVLGQYDTPGKLWEALAGIEAITIPHSVAAINTGATWEFDYSIDWSYRNDEKQPLVEIFSNWGLGECADCQLPGNFTLLNGCSTFINRNIKAGYFVQDALAMGHRLGMVGSGDTHGWQGDKTGCPGFWQRPGDFGLVGLYATDLTREAIYDGLKNRRTFATTGPKIVVDFSADGHFMGEEFTSADKPKLEFQVDNTESSIQKIEIVKGWLGAETPFLVVFTETCGSTSCVGEWIDQSFFRDSFYYLRVVRQDGHMAWSSPIWINVEPSPYGMNTDLWWLDVNLFPMAKWETVVREMASAGVKFNRTTIYWPGIRREDLKDLPPENWNWRKHDDFVQLLSNYGISPLGYFMFTPGWAKKDPACASRWQDRICAPDPLAWEETIEKIVERYGCGSAGKCQIRLWELWNEEDLNKDFYQGDCQQGYFCGSLGDYFEMLYRGYQAVKRADPQATVALGGVSQLGINDGGFLDLLLSKTTPSGQPAGDFFDVFNFHFYYSQPNDALNGLTQLERLRTKYNLQDKPIWITELNRSGNCPDLGVVAQKMGPLYQDLIARGVEKVFWFKVGSREEPSGSGCYQEPGILNGDTYERLEPMYSAYQQMAGGSDLPTPTPALPPPRTIIENYGTPDFASDLNSDGLVNGLDFGLTL